MNNTANVDVAGVRIFVPTGITFKNSRFIGNRAPSSGADAAIVVRDPVLLKGYIPHVVPIYLSSP